MTYRETYRERWERRYGVQSRFRACGLADIWAKRYGRRYGVWRIPGCYQVIEFRAWSSWLCSGSCREFTEPESIMPVYLSQKGE